MLRRDWIVLGAFLIIAVGAWVRTAQARPQPAQEPAKVIPYISAVSEGPQTAVPVPNRATSVMPEPDKPAGHVLPVYPAQTVFAAGYGSAEIVSDAQVKAYAQEAATAAGLGPEGWAYLYAIAQAESDLGQNPSTSVAGAEGPMQFLPSTWAEYGAGGSILDIRDSMMAAGRMLAANGAPGDWPAAIFAYNHSSDYVRGVEAEAVRLSAGQ
jgi:soluble lytic murein transglycosylase-like protein